MSANKFVLKHRHIEVDYTIGITPGLPALVYKDGPVCRKKGSAMRINLLFLIILLGSFVVPASAGTVNFDDVVVVGLNPIQTSPVISDGFSFDSAHFHIVNSPTNCTFGGCVSNGTQYLAEDAPGLAFPVTMTQVGGGAFSLTSFDGDKLWMDDAAAAAGGFGNASFIHVVGTHFGGGSIIEDFQLDGTANFQHFSFGAGWDNLQSVIWSGGVAGSPGNFSMAVDNIGVGVVPEPGSLLLLGTGLLGAVGVIRRKINL